MEGKYPRIEYVNGEKTAIYDPESNTFGSYNADGSTRTFFKPTSSKYFQKETDDAINDGGELINPSSEATTSDSADFLSDDFFFDF